MKQCLMQKLMFSLHLVALSVVLLVCNVYVNGLGFGVHVKAHLEDINQKADFSADFDYGIKRKRSLVLDPQRGKF